MRVCVCVGGCDWTGKDPVSEEFLLDYSILLC